METKKQESSGGRPTFLCRVRNAGQLVLVSDNNSKMKIGGDMNVVAVIENGGMVVNRDGKIEAVGPEAEIAALYDEKSNFDNEVDATGKVVLPGLVDGHTHPVWAGNRVGEFAMKLEGATYMDIHKIGGGINFTVRHTREASEDQLLRSLLKRLRRMLRSGCTLLEAKSGYGLAFEHELKMLRVLQRANGLQPIDVVLNFCGAHSVPQGADAEVYAQDIIDSQLPALQQLRERKELDVSLVDVFCEKGVFSTDTSRKILEKAQQCGFRCNFHGDELNYTASCEMGAEIGALAISHVEHVSEEGIRAMAEKKVVATLLPSTAYILRITPPPARALIDGNVPVALGTDFNPNAHCMSLPFIMNLACVTMKMTMNEALVAATLNAAASLDQADMYGSLEVGKWGDFVVLDAEKWEHIIYELVDPPIEQIYKRGKLVCDNSVLLQ